MASFIFFMMMFFPYEMVVIKRLDRISETYNIPMLYDMIHADCFDAEIVGLSFGDQIPWLIESVHISYSPLTLISDKVTVVFQGDGYFGRVNFNKENIKIVTDIRLAELSLEDSVKFKGTINMKGDISKDDWKGTFKVVSDGITVNDGNKQYSFGQLDGDAVFNKNQLSLENIPSDGNSKIILSGRIFINKSNLKYSTINIRGNAASGDKKGFIHISGRLVAPTILIN